MFLHFLGHFYPPGFLKKDEETLYGKSSSQTGHGLTTANCDKLPEGTHKTPGCLIDSHEKSHKNLSKSHNQNPVVCHKCPLNIKSVQKMEGEEKKKT